MASFRKENDILGDINVPIEAYYGSFTARALDNFQISGKKIQRDFIETLAIIKKAAAYTNHKLGF